MPKPDPALPLQFFVTSMPSCKGRVDKIDAGCDARPEFDDGLTAKLAETYKALWSVMATLASGSERGGDTSSECLFETHSLPGYPDVFLRYEVLENDSLAVVLEQNLTAPEFRGQAGLIVGARGVGKTSLLIDRRARPTIEMELQSGRHHLHVQTPSFQTYAAALVSNVSSSPEAIEQVHQWHERTEKVVTVPKDSLRETATWLRAFNRELANERESREALADAQNDSFMKLYASLADPRKGA